MLETYQTALQWSDLMENEWKVIGQFYLPSDPTSPGTWVYLIGSATTTDVERQIDAKRRNNIIVTCVKKHQGNILLLARRVKKRVSDEYSGPRGYAGAASWIPRE